MQRVQSRTDRTASAPRTFSQSGATSPPQPGSGPAAAHAPGGAPSSSSSTSSSAAQRQPTFKTATMASYPFQRGGGDSPRSPEYFSGANSPPTRSSTWRGSKKRIFEGRIVQLAAAGFTIVLLIGLFSLLSGGSTDTRSAVSTDSGVTVNRFIDFEGDLDCRISSTDLYLPPSSDPLIMKKKLPFCKDRQSLLEALNGGGRHGFDEPFVPRGCHFKWYSTKEICMILERFDGVAFVGDELIAQIYASFNILLRQNLAMGAMEQWRMSDKERDACRCSNQFVKQECNKFFVTAHDQVGKHDSEGGTRSPYMCNRIPHFYLPVRGSPAGGDQTSKLANLLAEDPHSWKPVAIIHSLGLSTAFSWQSATNSMDEWLTIADGSGRNTPYLWIGPNAAGHLKPPDKILQEGNNALWHYNILLGKEAAKRGVENLSFYNMTLQAESWDGSNYGEKVSIVQAMMIVNWLAKLETT